jgi:beta-glucanase (GH16 family)
MRKKQQRRDLEALEFRHSLAEDMFDARHSFLLAISALILAVNTANAQSTPDSSLRPQSKSPTAAKLLFDDEFNGDKLNLKSWYRCFEWANQDTGCGYGPPYNLEWYLPKNISVSGGFLNLTAKRHRISKDFPYTAGIIESGGLNCQPPNCNPPKKLSPGFTFKYGYMEMRSKFPPGHGMWPAFWLLPIDGSWPPEIDAIEWQGGTPTIDYATIHWRDKHGHLQQDGTAYDTGVNLSAAYHTYGVDWQANSVTWYFDGTAIKTFTKSAVIPHKPMYVIVNLAVGGWISFPNKHTHFPATMQVAYVRVWNHKP